MRQTVVTVALAVTVLLASFSGVAVGQAPQVTSQADGTVDCEYPVAATDATGTEVTVDDEPERVVVLGPSAAQVMWDIGAQDKVVGMPVNQYTSYLDGSDSKTNVVDDQGQPIRERVVGLEPDIVLAPNIIQNDTVENLRAADLTVYRFEGATSFDDVAAKTELTGQMVGEFESAAQVSAEMQGTVAAIENAVEGEERPRVYYPLGGGFTAGSNTFVNDIVNSAGADNIATDSIDGYNTISSEVVAEQDPQWLIIQEGFAVPSNEGVNGTTAVRENQIVRVNPNYINQPGPRTTQVLRTLAETFHPEAYGQIDFDTIETPEPTTCGGSNETTETEPAGANGPGFGAGVAVAAVLALGLVARRQS
ncbi:PGF-CTERM-anchored ABC transporter substrate-binding protein [Salinibaculum salinum]|uniref:PGF-CTERM-anchored ABC transporter substrate-binding protein n=1 Tax=Salinibaculum salinum TaxID=3131996 RepID=UPI0030EDC84B